MLKGDSRIEYVPFEKKTVDYMDDPKKILVENKKTLRDYEEHIRVEYIPKEITVRDYYAVEHVRCYIPEIVPESVTVYVPI